MKTKDRYYCHPAEHKPCKWMPEGTQPKAWTDTTDMSAPDFVEFLSKRRMPNEKILSSS